MVIGLEKINTDKRYKILDNCFISYNEGLKCLVASIENNTIVLNDRQIDTIYNYVRKNSNKIFKYWNKKSNSILHGDFIQIDIFS